MTVTPLRIPVAGFELEAQLHAPGGAPGGQPGGDAVPGAVVCHPHPLRGGDMHNNVVTAIVRGLTAAGMGALPFNFRGVGGSGGQHGGGVGEREDAAAALEVAATHGEIDARRLGLAGYSFGAGVAAAVASSPAGAELRALVLVSPPMRDDALLAQLSAIAIPVLVLAGTEDHVCPADRVRELAVLPHVEVVAAPGIDHFWWGHETIVSEAVTRFVTAHLRG